MSKSLIWMDPMAPSVIGMIKEKRSSYFQKDYLEEDLLWFGELFLRLERLI